MTRKPTSAVRSLLDRIDTLPINEADRISARAEYEHAEASADAMVRAWVRVRRAAMTLRRSLTVRQHRHG